MSVLIAILGRCHDATQTLGRSNRCAGCSSSASTTARSPRSLEFPSPRCGGGARNQHRGRGREVKRLAGHPAPRCNGRSVDEPIYAYLLGLYLGDGHIVEMKRGVYRLSISQDERYPGLIAECSRAMARVGGGGRTPARRQREGRIEVYSHGKQLVMYVSPAWSGPET
jgi:hypothetical protein